MALLSYYGYQKATGANYVVLLSGDRQYLEKGLPPDPACDGYSFVRWYPYLNATRKGIQAVKVKIGTTTFTLDDVEAPILQSDKSVKQTWQTEDGDVSVTYTELNAYTLSYTTGGATYTHSVTSTEGHDTFTMTIAGSETTVVVDTLFADESDESDSDSSDTGDDTVYSDLDYYAMYNAIGYTVKYWHYDDAGVAQTDKATSVAVGATFDASTMQPANPTRSGRWTFSKWLPTPPSDGVTIVSDLTFEGIFTAGTITLTLSSNGGTPNEQSLVCTWGAKYPTIPYVPTKTGFGLSGIWLCKTDGTEIEKVYDEDGLPMALVNQTYLDTNPTDCKLLAKWTAKSVYDLDGLREAVGIVPKPFASDPSSHAEILDDASTTSVNFKTGLPPIYAKPVEEGGKVITRQIVNSIGNIGSQCQFFEQCGGIFTFDQDVCDKNGGYPKDAFLQYFDEDTSTLRTVVSMLDDNTWNFLTDGVDGEHWKFVDDNPEVRMFIDYADYVDIGSTLFVETGIPDLYEVPYDSYLQLFAVGSLDCSSLKRETTEDVHINTKIYTETDTEGNEETIYEYDDINGMYFTYSTGSSFLDIYRKGTEYFGSVIIGGFAPFEHVFCWPNEEMDHFEKICPLSSFSAGVFLSKGDKIRIRNSFTDKVSSNFSSKESVTGKVHDKLFTDKVLKRVYLCKFANLYKRNFTI